MSEDARVNPYRAAQSAATYGRRQRTARRSSGTLRREVWALSRTETSPLLARFSYRTWCVSALLVSDPESHPPVSVGMRCRECGAVAHVIIEHAELNALALRCSACGATWARLVPGDNRRPSMTHYN